MTHGQEKPMATRKELFPFSSLLFFSRIRDRSAIMPLLLVLSTILGAVSPVSAQTSQQYVYSSAAAPSAPTSVVSGFNKASQTGALTLVPGSPFSDRLEGGLMAIDGQGKFLFVLNPTSDDISMFQIDPASGALSEVPGSPFSVPPISPNTPVPSQPLSIAAERSGKFLFVGYFFAFGGNQGPSSVASLAIDTSGASPVLRPIESVLTQSGGAPIQLLTDSKGLHLYVGLGISTSGMLVGGAEVYSIDSATGNLLYQGMADRLLSFGRDYAIDPQNRFFFAGGGDVDFIESCIISPVDGTASTCSPIFYLGYSHDDMLVENSGHFLYIAQSSQGVVVYSIDQTTGAPTQVGSVTGIQLAKGNSVADPMGPYIYSANVSTTAGAVHAYQVNQQTGNLTEIPGSPFSTGVTSPTACCQGLAISGNPVQAISGPAVTIFPSTAVPFAATAGASSATQIFSIVNVGNQLLALNSISITGTNASSFSQTNTCLATLALNASCSVSINFNPATAGMFTAALQIADNAPSSPQTLALNGTGVAAVPAVTLSPTALSFPSTTQGTSSSAQTLTVLNTGTAPLHVSSVSLSGPNASDFSFTNNCGVPVAPSANCTISLIFTPSAAGSRAANLMITDDAASSPQTLLLSGTGIATVPAVSFSPPTPSFPSTTQGTSSAAQTLTVTNSGNAPLLISSVTLSGPNPADFSFTANCTAPVSPAANCTISLVFSPLASGQRTASLVIADDAPGSPQTVQVSGNANPAFTVGAATGSSMSASVSAGQTAQYQLQLTPGSGYSGAISLTCSGAPLGAVCQVPTSVAVTNGSAVLFSVSVTTSGSAVLPPSIPVQVPPISGVPLLPIGALALVLLICSVGFRAFESPTGRSRLAVCGAFTATILCVILGVAGCGGGSAAVTPPPPIVTPSGTSTISITPNAMSLSGQPLQLQPIQLTLTVK
jgi:6-phosphogluconolactonase (cycloisomerase 2 family)